MSDEPKRRDLAPLLAPLARRLNAAVWLNAALPGVILALALFAVGLVVLKALWPAYALYSLSVLGLLPVALAWGCWSARRRGLFFRPAELVEIVDHLYKNDGSVSAAFERAELLPAADFYARVRVAVAPRLPRMDALHYLRRVLPVLALAAVSILLPARPPAESARGQAVLTTLAQPLLEKLEQFEEVLPEEKAEELRAELEKLAESPEGISREKWEALEEMAQRLDEAVAESRQSLSGLAGGLRQLTSLAGEAALASASGELDANLEGLLSQLLSGAQDDRLPMNSELRKEISDALEQMCSAGACSQEMLDRLSELCDKLGRCMGEGDEPFEREGEGPGRGGVDRGRGDAPMMVGDEKPLDQAAFQESELRNRFLSPADLVDLGITPVEPRPDPGRFSPGIARAFERQEGSGVSRTRISPSRREVIARYFQNTEE